LAVNGRERYHIARVLPDGSVGECFDPGLGPNGFVLAMAEQHDGRILAGGVFRSIEGQNRPYLARLKAESGCGPGEFGFSSSHFIVREGSPTALVTLLRNGSAAAEQSVRVQTADGSAKNGEDYVGGDFQLHFSAGERAQTLSIPIRADALAEGDETVLLKLSSPDPSAASSDTATLTILDESRFEGAGEVDPNFRPMLDGPVTAAITNAAGDWLVAIAITNASGLVDYSRFGLRRLTLTGLAHEGFVATNIIDGEIESLAELTDGYFVAAGTFQNVNGVFRPGLARFDPFGRFDPSFEPFPKNTNNYRYPAVSAVIASPDGALVCAGKLPETESSPYGFRLFRIRADGTLDQEFLAAQEREVAGGTSLASLPDGSYIIGIPGENAVFARYLRSGARDPRYIPPALTPGAPPALVTLADGSIIGAGSIPFSFGFNSPSLVRLAPNGAKSAEFEANCARSFDIIGSSLSAVLAGDDDRFLAAGQFRNDDSNEVTTVMRFYESGMWDPSFSAGSGATPRWLTYPGGSNEVPSEIRVLKAFPGGGWLIGGEFAGFDGVAQPFLVRLLDSRRQPDGFRLAAANWQVRESADHFCLNVVREGKAGTTASVHLSATPISALPNIHFAPVDEDLVFGPGEWLKQVPIKIVQNSLAEPNRSFEVRLSNSVSSPATATVMIVDDDTNVEFISDLFEAIEGEPTVQIGVRRIGAASDDISVAIGGDTVTFAASEAASVTNYVGIPIPDDEVYTPDQLAALQLSIVSGAATLGSRSTATLRIVDNDFPQSPGRGVAGYINVIEPDPAGGVYLAGQFTAVHGVQRQNLARLLANGEVDRKFDPGAVDGEVTSLAVLGDSGLVIGGDFISVAGQPRRQVALLRSTGILDPTFDPGAGPLGLQGEPARIFALLASPDGGVLVGGRFQSFQGYTALSLVRLETNGAMDLSFSSPFFSGFAVFPIPKATPTPPTVREIRSRTGGGLVVLGDLTVSQKNGALLVPYATTLVGLRREGLVDTNFVRAGSGNPITTLCPLPDGRWLAGSIFTRSKFTGTSPTSTDWLAIYRLEADGRPDPSFVIRGAPEEPASSSIRKIIPVLEGRILFVAELGGTNVGGLGKTVVGRLLPDGAWDETFQPLVATNSLQSVFAIKYPFPGSQNPPDAFESAASIRGLAAQPDGTVTLGGTFNEINGDARRRLARVNPDGVLRGQLAFMIRQTTSGLIELKTSPEIEIPYLVERSTDLLSWEGFRTNNTPWTELSFYAEVPAVGPYQFFRFRQLR
jgi:uncharacterized delta-60 repeat protein